MVNFKIKNLDHLLPSTIFLSALFVFLALYWAYIGQFKLVVNIKKWVNINKYKYVYIKLVLACWKNWQYALTMRVCSSLTTTYFEPHWFPSHQFILLTQGSIHEIFQKKYWELAVLKNSDSYFASYPWKQVKVFWVARMGRPWFPAQSNLCTQLYPQRNRIQRRWMIRGNRKHSHSGTVTVEKQQQQRQMSKKELLIQLVLFDSMLKSPRVHCTFR